jgi:outer membrane protein assembly factor BamB
MMTEEQLLALVREKDPEELSAAECAALQAALPSSAALRRECAERIRLEQCLAHAVGRPRVSVEKIIARARGGSGGTRTRLGFLIGLALVAAVAIVLGGRAWRREPAVVPARGGDHGSVAVESRPGDAELADTVVPDEPAAESAAAMTPAAPSAAAAATVTPPAAESSPAAAAKPGVAEPGADEPWLVDLRGTADLPSSPAAVFAELPVDRPPPSADVLRQWLAAVPGRPASFGVQRIGNITFGKFDGLARLRPQLVAGTVLRLAVLDYRPLRIHAWSGTRGVTFDAHGQTGPWAGYATSRDGTEPVPARLVLAARDEGRMSRTNPKPPAIIDLRHADGLLTLSRGDVRLLEVPLAEPPGEIYFEGNCMVRAIAMAQAQPLPANRWPPAVRPFEAVVPARQTWQRSGGEGVSFEEQADGGVELVAEKNPQPAWAALPMPAGGPGEIAIRIDAFTPGTGICLGDKDGRPSRVFAFLSNKQVQPLVQLEPVGAGDNRVDVAGLPRDRSIPFVDGTTWLKIGYCGGLLRCCVSTDGVRWVQACDPVAIPSFASLGLYAAAHPTRRSITVGEIRRLPFARNAALAAADLRDVAAVLPESGPLPAWREAVVKAKPPAADDGAWLRTCAVRRLADGCSKDLAVELLLLLWQEAAALDLSIDDRMRLLDEIAALAPVWSDPPATTRLAALYEELADDLCDAGNPRGYSSVAHAQQTSPLLCYQMNPCFSEPRARREVLALALAGRTGDLAALSARLAYFGFDEPPANAAFFAWAKGGPARQPATGRERLHPLVTEPGKEGATLAADLNAALESGEYRHACDLFLAADEQAAGLLPDRRDPDLAASLPVTVATTMADEPRLLEVMRTDYGERGGIRVRQAIDLADPRAAEAATVQYFGTEAAAEAHAWLGDRCLSGGDIAAALDHYRAARRSAAPALEPRLSAAESVARSVAAGSGAAPATRLPVAGDYETAARSRLEGDVGAHPGGIPGEYSRSGPGWTAQSFDWVARQAAVLPLADRLLVSNRFQLASYDPQSGTLQWRAGVGGDAGPTHEWAAQPMRPVASATHAFVRRLKKTGPVLAAIKLADGMVAWESPQRPDRFLASDPVLVEETLHLCTATKSGEEYAIALAAFDAVSGELLREQPLVVVRQSWWRQRDCQLAAIDGGFVITCGGSVVCCDRAAAIRWVRRDLWVPGAVDSFWMFQAQAPPVVAGDRMFIVQPGVPAVFAVDAASGRVAWKASLPDVRRLLGFVRTAAGRPGQPADCLIVERSSGIVALAADSGTLRWRFESGDLLDAGVAADEGVLVAVRDPVPNEKARQPTLVWLDPASGLTRLRTALPGLKDADPRLGPLVRQGDRVWTLFGRGPNDPARDLVELVPR